MGSCNSCETRSSTDEDDKVKVILLNGKLLEYSNPIKVCHILQEYPKCFVCNADDMNFNDFVTAIYEEEELRKGELYFVLPMSWLNRRLEPVDMAALAVKGSIALSSGSDGGGVMTGNMTCCGCISRRFFGRLMSTYIGGRKYSTDMTATTMGGGGSVRSCGNYQRLKFGTSLSVIVEE